MPKYAARIDANQPDIVKSFRKLGCSVAHIHMVGDGIPDIIVGFQGNNYLIEIKDGSKPPSKRKLTDDEQEWHDNWLGSVHIIESISDVHNFLIAVSNS